MSDGPKPEHVRAGDALERWMIDLIRKHETGVIGSVITADAVNAAIDLEWPDT